MAATYTLPDLAKICHANGYLNLEIINPHYKQASAASKAWVKQYNLFNDRQQRAFDNTDGALLAAYAYPAADEARFRIACDFMNLLWVVDEISDDQGGEEVEHTGKIWIKSMADPGYEHDSELGRLSRDFRNRFVASPGGEGFATDTHLQRFLQRCKQTMEGTAREAELRQQDKVLDLESYVPLRRLNVGLYVCFAFMESLIGTTLPEFVYEDPVFNEIYELANDLTWWTNDLYSYNMEQAKGHHGNNVITVLMRSQGLSLQSAVDYTGVHFAQKMQEFQAARRRIPTWGFEIDVDVERCIRGLESWITGNLVFSGVTDRYLTPEEKASRVVTLRLPTAGS